MSNIMMTLVHFTDGSRDDQKVGCAVVFGKHFSKLRVRDMGSICAA